MSDLISKKELYRKLGEAYNKGFLTWGANEIIKDIIGECDSVENKGECIPDTATNEDVMNETLRRVFPKTIFIRSQSIANKTQAINMSDEWLGRNYKEMYK